MNVVSNKEEMEGFLTLAARVSKQYPVVVSEFIEQAKEIEIDAVARDGELFSYAISEHVEFAGVHSGDATMVFPPQKLYFETVRRIKKNLKQSNQKTEQNGQSGQNGQNEQHKKADWHKIICYGRLAEMAKMYLSCGSKIYIEGYLKHRTWENEVGQKQWMTEFIARELIIFSPFKKYENDKQNKINKLKIKNTDEDIDDDEEDEDEEIQKDEKYDDDDEEEDNDDEEEYEDEDDD